MQKRALWAAQILKDASFGGIEVDSALEDELDKVERMGIRLVSEEEARQLDEEDERTIVLRDFDYTAIQLTFAAFGVDFDPDGLALAVFDHGNAPAGTSDRQLRFDYLEQRIRAENRLLAFAHPRGEVPDHLTHLKAVEASAANFDGEVMLMDTAPAAVLGALLDPMASVHQQAIVCNAGNFHTLAFRLGSNGIAGVFEHHTGEIDREQLGRTGMLEKWGEANIFPETPRVYHATRQAMRAGQSWLAAPAA